MRYQAALRSERGGCSIGTTTWEGRGRRPEEGTLVLFVEQVKQLAAGDGGERFGPGRIGGAASCGDRHPQLESFLAAA